MFSLLCCYDTYEVASGPGKKSSDNENHDQLIDSPDGVPTFASDRVVDRDPYATPTSASDTMTGATSADVHSGYGHPGSGMSSSELHHNGQSHRKKYGFGGAEQFGTNRPEDLKRHKDEKKHDFNP